MGYGIQAAIEGRLVHVGSARFMGMEGIDLPARFRVGLEEAQVRGASVVYVAIDRQAAGAIELQPTLRPEAREVTAELRRNGLDLYIISGDQAAPTEALAAEVGIDKYFAEVLPQDKSRMVERLQRQGRHVCFVGDGINDAIALKAASVSVSLRGASSLATNTAQIVLMDESLRHLSRFFDLARDYETNLRTLLMTTFLPGHCFHCRRLLPGYGCCRGASAVQPEYDRGPAECRLARAGEPGCGAGCSPGRRRRALMAKPPDLIRQTGGAHDGWPRGGIE